MDLWQYHIEWSDKIKCTLPIKKRCFWDKCWGCKYAEPKPEARHPTPKSHELAAYRPVDVCVRVPEYERPD